MDCTLIHDRLVGYHFAALSDAEREDIEAHLVECKDCLRTYLTLKSHIDRGGAAGEAPREAVRLRLRAAVEMRFRPSPWSQIRRWLVRPVPLYQGLAVATVVAAALFAVPVIDRALHPVQTLHENERVDTARPSAVSLTLY